MGPVEEEKNISEASTIDIAHRKSRITGVSDIYVDPVIERRCLRKIDLRIAPIFMTLYFLSFLNRSNIGNAAIAGLKTQLHLSDGQYSTAVSVFYATYISGMLPAVLLLRKLKAHRLITVMAFAWSIITIGTAFCKTYGELLACRLLLGLAESGFFSCISLYMTMIYNRQEQGLRFAYLFTSSALSGMFGGLIATAVTYIGTASGLESWSWLYIVEGCVSVVIVPFVWLGLPAEPYKAKFFTEEELDLMMRRELLRQEYMGQQKFDWGQVRSAFMDLRIWIGAFLQFLGDIVLYGFSTFLPIILRNGLGFTRLQAQYLAVPVYFLGLIAFFVAAVAGDKYGYRGSILFFQYFFGIVGYALIARSKDSAIQYFGCYLVAIVLYGGTGLNEMWIVNNTAPHYRRAAALGLSQVIGNSAGIVSGQIYREAPYHLGNYFSLGCCCLAVVLAAAQLAYFRSKNAKKDRILREEVADDRKSATGEDNLGFRYLY